MLYTIQYELNATRDVEDGSGEDEEKDRDNGGGKMRDDLKGNWHRRVSAFPRSETRHRRVWPHTRFRLTYPHCLNRRPR